MYYTIYKTINLINNKIYIGSHVTKNINDSYLGSGTLLKRAIKKYGNENFTKEILFIFDNPREMYAKEAEIVNENFLLEENTYNINLGGHGGFNYLNTNPSSMTQKRLDALKSGSKFGIARIKELYNTNSDFKNKFISNIINAGKKSKEKYPKSAFYGKKHSEETKQHLSNVHKGKHTGNKNSQYGTCWITNGKENKKIKKEYLDLWLNKGYNKGRKIKERKYYGKTY